MASTVFSCQFCTLNYVLKDIFFFFRKLFSLLLIILFWKNNQIFFLQKIGNLHKKNIFLHSFLKIFFCQHNDLILTNEFLNERIWYPLSISAKKCRFFFNSTLMKIKSLGLMPKFSWYLGFCMRVKQQKTFLQEEPMPNLYKCYKHYKQIITVFIYFKIV